MTENPPEGILAGPVSEENFFVWEAYILGPPDTPYEGGLFKAILTFPSDYPLNPPKMRFVTPMWHPNSTFYSSFLPMCFNSLSLDLFFILIELVH
jgi:ubiquitin-protein ligase